MNSNLTHGMNLGEVEEMGRFLKERAAAISAVGAAIDARVRATSWCGGDADRFRGDWWPDHKSALMAMAKELDGLGQSALNNVAEQRQVSEDPSTSGPDLSACVLPGGATAELAGRNALAELLAMTDGPVPQGQIMIRVLPDGSAVVVLPGVQDLTDSVWSGARGSAIGQVVLPGSGAVIGGMIGLGSEALRTRGTARDLRYATSTALDPRNRDQYATMVRDALRKAGVAEGAHVAFIGHSYGAYAASALASDPNFNHLLGKGGTYRVTHVLAAAADTDQFMPRVAPGTRFLVLNNRHDLVVQGEQGAYAVGGSGSLSERLLGTDGETGTHSEQWFDGGAARDAGHDPSRYVHEIREGGGSGATRSFYESFGTMYGTAGEGAYYDVPG